MIIFSCFFRRRDITVRALWIIALVSIQGCKTFTENHEPAAQQKLILHREWATPITNSIKGIGGVSEAKTGLFVSSSEFVIPSLDHEKDKRITHSRSDIRIADCSLQGQILAAPATGGKLYYFGRAGEPAKNIYIPWARSVQAVAVSKTGTLGVAVVEPMKPSLSGKRIVIIDLKSQKVLRATAMPSGGFPFVLSWGSSPQSQKLLVVGTPSSNAGVLNVINLSAVELGVEGRITASAWVGERLAIGTFEGIIYLYDKNLNKLGRVKKDLGGRIDAIISSKSGHYFMVLVQSRELGPEFSQRPLIFRSSDGQLCFRSNWTDSDVRSVSEFKDSWLLLTKRGSLILIETSAGDFWLSSSAQVSGDLLSAFLIEKGLVVYSADAKTIYTYRTD